jgi:tetratricopeptide (TPR) repeat protein
MKALLLLALPVLTAQTLPEKLIEAGHWKKARTIVEARIREAPDDALANFLLSQIRNAFGDQKSPLPLAEKAVALDGGVAKYHRQLAEVIGVTAQHASVLQQLILARRFKKEIDTALKLDPTNVQALRDLMEFYLLAPGIAGGDKARARSVAERIGQADAAEGFLAQARLAEMDKQSGTLEQWYCKAADAQPASYRARIALAGFYLSPGHVNPEAAVRRAQEAMKIDPARAEAYAILAAAYATSGQWSEMESTLVLADNESPDDLVPHYRAADILLASGRELQRAERHFRRYLDGDPEGNAPPLSEARRKLSLILEKSGRSR